MTTQTSERFTIQSGSSPYAMTEETLAQRAEKVNAGRFKTQLFAGILASVSSISFGTVLGWSSPAIRTSLDNDVNALDKSVKLSWVVSLGPLGCAIGSPVWSYFNRHLGPKRTMLILAPLLFIVWAVIGSITRDQSKVELAMRFFCGFFAISYRICGETLLLDSVHNYYLRQMVVTYRSCVTLGILITYVMGYSVTDQFFSYTNCGIVLLHFIMLIVCPESPVYLYEKNAKKAEKSLIWYRGRANIYVEMRNIKKDSDIRKVDPGAYKYMLFSKVVVKAIAIIMMINIAQVFSCYFMFIYFNPAVIRLLTDSRAETLAELDVSTIEDCISRNIDAFILGANMFVSCFISTWVHYRVMFGVRKPLIISCSLLTIVLFAISAYMYLYERKNAIVYKANNWIYLILVHLLIICYELGLSCCGDIMLMDYIPNQVFPRAKSIVKITQWFIVFFMTKNFFYIAHNLYGSGSFLIFAILSFCISLAVFIWVVESKGKTLVQVQMEIGGNPVGSRGIFTKRTVKSTEALLTF